MTPPRPTDAELEILQVLWAHGPCTVKQVQSVLAEARNMGYTTVLKLLQIMHEKGFVLRNEARRAHVYRARVKRESTQRNLVSHLLSRGFEGSSHDLLLRALEAKPCSAEELQKIRQTIDQLEAKAKQP